MKHLDPDNTCSIAMTVREAILLLDGADDSAALPLAQADDAVLPQAAVLAHVSLWVKHQLEAAKHCNDAAGAAPPADNQKEI